MQFPVFPSSSVQEKPNHPADLGTTELWKEFKEGSELAFTAIYKKYAPSLYHYGERLTRHKELIEDSIHDFFVELWRQRENYGEITNLKFYLLKGFKHRLLKNLKKSKKLPVDLNLSDEYDFQIVFSREFEWIAKQSSEKQEKSILHAVNSSLSPREKEAITLRFYDGLSYEEIADLMTLSKKSTYKLIYRAIEVLKKNIPENGIF